MGADESTPLEDTPPREERNKKKKKKKKAGKKEKGDKKKGKDQGSPYDDDCRNQIKYCCRCGEPVFLHEARVIGSYIFHQHCFLCANPMCRRNLETIHVHPYKGRVFCVHCGPRASTIEKENEKKKKREKKKKKKKKKSSEEDVCNWCGQDVSSEDKILICDTLFHKRCLYCPVCNCRMSMNLSEDCKPILNCPVCSCRPDSLADACGSCFHGHPADPRYQKDVCRTRNSNPRLYGPPFSCQRVPSTLVCYPSVPNMATQPVYCCR